MVEMTEEAKEARRAYYRAWNKRNKDKVQERQARYWARRAEREKEQAKAKAKGGKTSEGKE